MTTSDFVVIDASVGVKWVIREEQDQLAAALFTDSRRSSVGLLTPPHFRFEVANAIWRKHARRLLTDEAARTALSDFAEFDTTTVAPPDLSGRAFELALKIRPGAIYDLLYVALAQIVGCTLWTADSKLANAVAGVPVVVSLLSTYTPQTA